MSVLITRVFKFQKLPVKVITGRGKMRSLLTDLKTFRKETDINVCKFEVLKSIKRH